MFFEKSPTSPKVTKNKNMDAHIKKSPKDKIKQHFFHF